MGSIEHFIEEFTYAGVFLVLFVAGLGVPIPEELPILVSGILAREGLVRWWLALPVCLVGVLTGDASIYWIGRHWGERVLELAPVRYMLSREREEALKAAYRRHGVKIVFTARHLMGFRAAAFLTAGIARVPFGKFLAVDTAAAMIGRPGRLRAGVPVHRPAGGDRARRPPLRAVAGAAGAGGHRRLGRDTRVPPQPGSRARDTDASGRRTHPPDVL